MVFQKLWNKAKEAFSKKKRDLNDKIQCLDKFAVLLQMRQSNF